ncbi:hypothetical protein DES53_12035 [Roseimicrobium gellanilyticum]|uniref:DUF3987 domain-containing protein n=1 Tax=Roseimicrobium gellanilyticum TaxID=748857 RepID=A0A366H1Q8_9BACT|nr:hypothetical protein [Roseimicrobium gellanilyticum]RBP35667.1 hypothetical protein DES53_12035 [Roseimicrobium gellanilyticum]
MDSLLEELSKGNGQCLEAFGGLPPLEPVASHSDPTKQEAEHWLLRNAPADNFAKALNIVPEPLKVLTVDAASRWKLRPESIMVVLLHVLAGIAGAKHRLRRAHLGISCPFNLIVCGEAPTSHNWIEFFAEPWLGHLRGRLRMHQAFGAAHFMNELKSMDSQSSFLFGSALDKNKQLVRTQLTLAPCAMERSPLPDKLLEALKHSWGRTVVSLNGGIDPMQELHSASRKQVVELSRLLQMSWKDMDLPAKGPIPCRGVIHLLWRSEITAARRVIWGPQSPWKAASPPVLVVTEGASPAYLVPLDAEVYGEWAKLCRRLVDSTESGHDAVVWSLSPEADALAAGFCVDLATNASKLAPLRPQQFAWFHELVIRLAMLLSITGKNENSVPGVDAIVSSEAMDAACILGRWLAREHYDCLKWLRLGPDDDGRTIFDETYDIDSIDNFQLEMAIMDRLGDKGPMTRRELSRTFHEMTSRTRDRAISGLMRNGFVIEMPDGRVKLRPLPTDMPDGWGAPGPFPTDEIP